MALPEQCRLISLQEIDENIIPKIRDLNEHSTAFKILTTSISEDCQKHPITLRLLTESEKHLAKTGAIYGIIDGHHRYRIAIYNKQNEILSIVLRNTNETTPDILADLKLALRLNESSIKMSPKEKGKILYDTMELTGRDQSSLAEELFGIKTSMAYRYLNAYKKSVGKKVITKPRKLPNFKMKNLKSAWRKIGKVKNIPQNKDECLSCLSDINAFEAELKKYKQILLAQDGVKDELQNRKSLC